MPSSPKQVLVVEDEAILALELEFILEENAIEVLGPVGRIEDALAMVADHSFDAALLDLNLHGERSDPVADLLSDRGIPFMFLSGHTRDILSERHSTRPLLSKPYVEAELLTALRLLLD